MKDIQQKLDKYNNLFVPGEKRTSEYEKHIKQKQRIKMRKQIAKSMKYEAKYLLITDNHLKQVYYLIDIFGDKFKMLHKRASEETIILAFIFYCIRIDNSTINLNNYRISKKYKLTDQVFSLIISRMLHYFMKQHPIAPVETTEYDHDLLLRGGF
ncbi:MAG: hypothetical protein IJ104_01000 [Methanobrevibacter sp.]|nr:hypothetical protein [Methanobrevibacter sp.]MBQ9024948.1 hypothetical protein [Methanobrevibacter sp.]